MSGWLTSFTGSFLTSGLKLLGILVLALLLTRLLKALTARLVKLAKGESRAALLREEQTRTLAGILHSTGSAVIWAAALLAALPELGINVTPFAAAAGLASPPRRALGFGAQHLVRDLINGFFIIFEDQFAVGDTVRIGEATGRVEHLTLRRTVVRDLTGTLWTIPNGEVRQLANLSRDWSQIFVDVPAADPASVDRVFAALEAVCAQFRADPAWTPALVDGPRVLGVESLTPSGAAFRLQLRTAPTRQHDAARELRRRILARFEQDGITRAALQRVELLGGKSN